MRGGVGIFCVLSMVGWTAGAVQLMDLAGYTARVKERVSAKVSEALAADGEASVRGVVTYSGYGEYFIQREKVGLKVMGSSGGAMVGEEVVIRGRPSLEGGRVIFVETSREKAVGETGARGSGALPAAVRLDAADLLGGMAGEKANWCRVELTGRVMSRTDTGFIMEVGEAPVAVRCAGAARGGTWKLVDFLEGSEVTHPQLVVRGVLELMLDQSVLVDGNEQVQSIRLNVASEADVMLVPDAPYLMAVRDRRLKRAAVIALVVLSAGLLWFAGLALRQRKRMYKARTLMAERKRMADDLHDTIEQYLVGAGMLVKLGRAKEAEGVLMQAKREIRDIVWGLKNDDMMRLGPAEMLRQLAQEENRKGLYRVDTKLRGLPSEMSASAMRDLCLIVREAIGNAVKHGGARHIAISGERIGESGWMLQVGNDGAQFEPEKAAGAKEGHFGLEGMRERARRIGAELRIEKRKKGMLVELRTNKARK